MIHGLSAGIYINELRRQGRFVNFLTEADRKIDWKVCYGVMPTTIISLEYIVLNLNKNYSYYLYVLKKKKTVELSFIKISMLIFLLDNR